MILETDPASEEQKLQLLSRLAKDTNRKRWNGNRLQELLKLPAADFDETIACMFRVAPIGRSVDSETKILPSSSMQFVDPQFPRHHRGHVLSNIVTPAEPTLDCSNITIGGVPKSRGGRLSGLSVFGSLIPTFKVNSEPSKELYAVHPKWPIAGHYRSYELSWIEKNWKQLPAGFRECLDGKIACGWAGAMRAEDWQILIPRLECSKSYAVLVWTPIEKAWGQGSTVALRQKRPSDAAAPVVPKAD